MGKRILNFDDGFTSANVPSEAVYVAIGSNQAIAASGTITFTTAANQIIKISGDGAAVSASSTPFGVTPPNNGSVFILVGTDNTNTVTIVNNDAADGCILNGDITLGLNDSVTLVYDSAQDRYIELNRNF